MKSFAPRAATDKTAAQPASKGPATADNRAATTKQRQAQVAIAASPRQQARQQQTPENLVPPRRNTTGLPDKLKAGVESLSGYSLDDVKVHYNSAKPAQLQALAYAQGTDIHLGPGQEKHMPHEAWHVVQQKQGRVRATWQMKGGIKLNDEAGLEREADWMGAEALQINSLWAGSAGAVPTVLHPPARSYQLARQQVYPIAQSHANGLVRIELSPGWTGVRGQTAGPDLGSEAVVQRTATQIRTAAAKNAEPQITQVVVRGRPASVYGNSMGDHTTAFIVHVEGLNVNLMGRTVPQAVEFMIGMAAHLQQLPGYHNMLLNTQDTRVLQRYSVVETSLHQHLQAARHTRDAQVQMHLLQEAIDAYLDARELIPFSTINVGEKSKGKAGKGHGESGPAGVLSTAEQRARAGQDGTDGHNVVAAIYGLFDFQSAGMAATEVNSVRLSLMTLGITFQAKAGGTAATTLVQDPITRLKMMWQQHCMTIRQLYPHVYNRVQKSLLSDNQLIWAMQNSIERDFKYLMDDATRYLEQLNQQYHNVTNELVGKNLVSGSKIVISRAKIINAIYANQAKLMEIIGEMYTLNNMMDNRFSTVIRGYETTIRNHQSLQASLPHFNSNNEVEQQAMSLTVQEQIANAEAGREGDQKAAKPGAIKNLGELGASSTLRPLKNFKGQIGDSEPDPKGESDAKEMGGMQKQQASSSGDETLSSKMQAMSIQVTLNLEGTITGMLSAGRPLSPFAGTMGAHSTAWAAHLDRVRASIRGRTIPEAYEALQALAQRVHTFYEAQQGKALGSNAKWLIKGALDQMITRGWSSDQRTLASLQDFIESILSFYNLIPDVSRERIDTTGKGEGTYRGRLLTYETTGIGTVESIKQAIIGMFDGKARSGALWENHLVVVSEAYPHSFNLVNYGKNHVVPKTSGLVAAIATRESEAEADEIKPLSTEQVEEMTNISHDREWLLGQNNCLINAIAEAAGIPLPLPGELIVAIRVEIGARLGTMLAATTPVLDIIARHLHLANGVVVVYHGNSYTDETTEVRGAHNNPVYIFHDGVNHFTPLR